MSPSPVAVICKITDAVLYGEFPFKIPGRDKSHLPNTDECKSLPIRVRNALLRWLAEAREIGSMAGAAL